uniref:Uncharacterized protein n=1 Tax=Pseudonaja textilis TaxID=8673 RepID=A0A670ZDX7_PSETE
MQKESNNNLDNSNDEKTLGNWAEIELLLEVLCQKVFNIIQSSISIASTEPELLNNAVRVVIMWVEKEEEEEEEENERSIHSQFKTWKEEWRDTIQKSVEERMKASPVVDNKNLSPIASTFLHMGKTMKMDMITVVQHIKQHYPEDFQVCNTYAKFYHHYFSSQMAMFADFELSKENNYLLLNWVQNLYPKDIKNNSDLVKELDEASLGNLLPLEQIKQLEKTYLSQEVVRILLIFLFHKAEPRILDNYYHSELSIDAIKVTSMYFIFKYVLCNQLLKKAFLDIQSNLTSTGSFFFFPISPFPVLVIMERIHLFLVQKYIERLMWRNTTLKSPEKQNQLSELIRSHASILYTFCTENGSNATWLESALPSLAEIIRLQDPDAIKIEVCALVKPQLLSVTDLSYNR